MNNKLIIRGGIGVLCLIIGSGVIRYAEVTKTSHNLSEDALMAIVKNDKDAFKNFLNAKGDINGHLPEIDGRTLTVAEGIAYYERSEFLDLLRPEDIKVSKDGSKDYDIMSIAVEKNSPEILKSLLKQKKSLTNSYGKKGWGLQHFASANCSDKVIELLHKEGKLNWNLQAKDGSTPLTLAAENGCLSVLSYWKSQKADFIKKDGRGVSALSVIKKNKEAAFKTLADSFETERMPAAEEKNKEVKVASSEPVRFYNKNRRFPKQKSINYSDLVEPGDRPDNANETADFAEFSD